MRDASLQLAKRRVVRRAMIELVVMYLAFAAAWYACGKFLRFDAFGVAAVLAGALAIGSLGRRQPSFLLACPFCRRAWATDLRRDRRVTCGGCRMRCRPYLLARLTRRTGFFGLVDAGTRRRIGPALPASKSAAQDHARWWADSPGFLLLIYVVVSFVSVALIGMFTTGGTTFRAVLLWVVSLLIAAPVAVVVSKRRYERLKRPLGTTCWKCRYDLTSLAAQAPGKPVRCPECGLVADPAALAEPSRVVNRAV